MTPLDTRLFLWLNASADTPVWMLALARWISTDLPAFAVLALLPWLLCGPAARRQVLGAGLAMALAWLSVRGIRETWHMPRPFELGLGLQWLAHEATAGFPSFHAAVAGAWAVALAAFAQQRQLLWLIGAGTVALAIVWSRVFLGLHFVSDIAAGLVLGGASAITARQCLAWLHGLFKERPDTNRHKTGGTAAR